MIDRDEIEHHRRSMNISIADVERDYIFGWLIRGIFTETWLEKTATLKGGNALRKAYFPSGRFSHDLDFSTPVALDSEAVPHAFNESCRSTEARTGVKFDVARNRIIGYQAIDETKSAIKIALYFEDFAGQTGHAAIKIRVDVSEFDKLQLQPVTRELIHQYSDANECRASIRVVALEEALADKMRCLLQRRHASDLFDLVYGCFVARDVDIDKGALLRVFLGKTVFGPNPIAAKQLLLASSWEAIRGFWSKVVAPGVVKFSFDEALDLFRTGLDGLFAGVSPRVQYSRDYISEPMRSQILHAGSESRLLRIVYNGVSRLAEPYSLVAKRTRTGSVSEYLYIYDRSGGQRSGPGIKSLKPAGIQAIDVLENEFRPRFENELARGVTSGVGSFSGRIGGYPTPVRADRAVRAVIRCHYCGREFMRYKNTSATLRKHNDGYGNQCPGRRGVRTR